MSKLFTKFRRSLVVAAAALALLSPALAAASGEVYYWQDSSRQAVAATGGVFDSTPVTLKGSPPSFKLSQAVDCSDGSGKGDLELKVSTSDYKAKTDPLPGTVSVSCNSVADTGAVNIYADASAAKASSNSGQSCKGGALAYILCPVYDFILGSIDSIERNVITPFLKLSPIVTKSNSPPHQIWVQFRNLANIGFILAFLVIIFAHTLSIGIDSYSLKKTLPRLAYAAIFVQFSYVLVALGVDAANILGAGIQAVLLAPLQGHGTLVINNVGGGIGLAVGIGAALTAAGGVITGTIFLVLFGAFFAVVGVFLTLIARQILVTLLLILSPLAFVAWVLPNTEHLFKMWRTSLIRLLLMYPMIVLLFAAGKLFSAAAIATSSSGANGTVTNAFLPLVSIVAYALPLYFIPLTFKYAGHALSTMHGWINGAHTAAKKGALSSSRIENAKNRAQQRRTELAAGEKINVFGMQVGGGALSKQAARGVFSPPGRGSNVRSLVAFNKDIDSWKKRLEEENMTYEGLTYLHLGEKWYSKEKGDIQGKISAARSSGNTNEVAVQEEALRRLEEGKQFGGVYSKNMAARAAAMLKRSDMDVLEDADRVEAMQYTGFNTDSQLGRLLGDQLWTRAREGARKTNVHLVFKDSKGNLDVEGLEKYVAKKPAGSWTDYTKDAIETMRDAKVLERMAQDQVTRQILIGTLSSSPGASIGAEQQRIVREVLLDKPYTGPPVNNDIV